MRASMMALALAASLCPLALFAAAGGVVEAVQYPAWLERDGYAVPLTPGTSLQARDGIRTGAKARVQLKLAEGSAVKLGQNARFVIERAEDRGVFRAALSVIAGAFRFTTPADAKGRRDVTIKVRNVSAGIRGTDLWGKSTDERDLVCLIEGRIDVGSEGHPTVTLSDPLAFYQKPRGQAPEVARVDERQMAEWALETELVKDGPTARSGGKWFVAAASFPARDTALAFARTLRAAGYPVEVTTVPGVFIVKIPGLAGENEARSLVANLRGMKGVGLPSVHWTP